MSLLMLRLPAVSHTVLQVQMAACICYVQKFVEATKCYRKHVADLA